MNEEQIQKAHKYIKNAWIAGSISFLLSLLFVIISSYNEEFSLKYGLNWWSLLDVGIIAAFTYGTYKRNRYSALGLLLFFIISKLMTAFENGISASLVVSLVFIYLFLQGTIAAFQIHKDNLSKKAVNLAEEDVNKKNKRLGYYFGISFGGAIILLFVIFMIIGLLSPEAEVISGKQLNKKYSAFVYDEGIISPSESIIYWYSDSFLDFKGGFYFITQERVVVYSKDWETPIIDIPYNTINDIEFIQDSSFIVDSQISLYLNDETMVYFPLSSDYNGDIKFHNKLNQLWKAKK